MTKSRGVGKGGHNKSEALYPGANELRWEDDATAQLIVNEFGAMSLETIAFVFGTTRERARQILEEALWKVRHRIAAEGYEVPSRLLGPLAKNRPSTIPETLHTSLQSGRILTGDGSVKEQAAAYGITTRSMAAIRGRARAKLRQVAA